MLFVQFSPQSVVVDQGPIQSNPIHSNKSNQIKSNQIKSNQIKSNQIKSNQIKSNHSNSLSLPPPPLNLNDWIGPWSTTTDWGENCTNSTKKKKPALLHYSRLRINLGVRICWFVDRARTIKSSRIWYDFAFFSRAFFIEFCVETKLKSDMLLLEKCAKKLGETHHCNLQSAFVFPTFF